MTIHLATALAPIVAPACVAFEAVRVVARDDRMDGPLAATESRLREASDLEPIIAAVRTMYRRFGVDPTKTRPSSEALLRRLRKGDTLPRINSVVDICNWCSAETQLPFGLYDLDRIDGDVVVRLGEAGEGYDGIRKDRVNVGGRVTLADAQGPFGNPTSDSARTMVTLDARRVLFVIFAPRPIADTVRDRAVALTTERVRHFTGAGELLRVLL